MFVKTIDLASLEWTLNGWEANSWRLYKPMQIEGSRLPDVGPLPARWPASVNQLLLEAGVIPDWTVGLNSLQCEWVEHRHWDYSTLLPRWLAQPGQSVRLAARGLDHCGQILINGKPAVSFEGTLLPHTIDLTPHLDPSREQWLSVVFEGAPDEQNQHAFTSRSHHFKPRFAYRWDWCPRIVPLGPWDAAWLEVGDAARLENVRPCAVLHEDFKTGQLDVTCRLWSAPTQTQSEPLRLTATLSLAGKEMARAQTQTPSQTGEQTCTLQFEPLTVTPWFPNGEGDQTLYDLRVELEPGGQSWQGKVGFKHVAWQPCQDAPQGALPWICTVNGNPLFLQGVNWSPIRPNYQDLTREDYAVRLRAYREMGCNVLRVWGGGLIEKSDFYELCDELGLMVWQEFPLSSSGVENSPPSDPQAIKTLCNIAASAIERRGGHASLLLWCGGNELTFDPQHPTQPGGVTPCDETHPCLKALGELARRMDPHHRYLPTTPTGPYFHAERERFGQGVHHNVHSPWNLEGTLEEWKDYFEHDDSLMRTEMGCPSASPLDVLLEFCGDQSPWPARPENPWWRHSGHWWINWDKFSQYFTEESTQPDEAKLARYVELSQELQAEALAFVTRIRKERFPRFAGLIFWMGHDTFPCPANTSLLDYHGRPKPAALAVGQLFRTRPEALRQRAEKNQTDPTSLPLETIER